MKPKSTLEEHKMYATEVRFEISSSETENPDFVPSEMAVCAQDWAVFGHLNTQIRSIEPFFIDTDAK